MNKKILIAITLVVLIIMLVIGGYLYLISKKSIPSSGLENLETINDAADRIKDSATNGVLPSIQTNLLEEKPDLNPIDKTNPYKDIKTNPFE